MHIRDQNQNQHPPHPQGFHLDNEQRLLCPYGAHCYRRNPEHFRRYSHPPGTMERNMGLVPRTNTDTNANNEP